MLNYKLKLLYPLLLFRSSVNLHVISFQKYFSVSLGCVLRNSVDQVSCLSLGSNNFSFFIMPFVQFLNNNLTLLESIDFSMYVHQLRFNVWLILSN